MPSYAGLFLIFFVKFDVLYSEYYCVPLARFCRHHYRAEITVRLKFSKSKNSTSVYVIKSTYENGKRSSKIVEKLGTLAQIKQAHPDVDPLVWAQTRLDELNAAQDLQRREVLVKLSPAKTIKRDENRTYCGGYLFLADTYYDLGLSKICKAISGRHRFTFNLDAILSRLIYGRILHPSSKLATHKFAQTLIEPSDFDIWHIYRALEVIAKESDFIQAELYKNSKKISVRNDAILYYDCTNYFFEIECESGIRQYGFSKDNKPNPLVQMGLFMDGDGIPLAFCINPGNTNEQSTLIPLEKKILSDFKHSKFVVCTDAGLSSKANRRFNDTNNRCFVTTQSIKQLKGFLKSWATDTSGWKLAPDGVEFDITELDEKVYADSIFFKERWIKEDGLEQRLIITFSLKYRNYQREIRARHIDRAARLINTNPKKITAPRQNDYKRLISKTPLTPNGEIADKYVFEIDENVIAAEEVYDGLYGVCTNLLDCARDIAAINKRRWEIEECFRIMKDEFKARPAYLSRDDRIKAHFATCFISLVIYRLLEKKLEDKYTCKEIIGSLRDMNFLKIKGEGYIPAYRRTDFTDDLHKIFGFRTDKQIVTTEQMRKIIRKIKK